jgi:uncharacterized protein DUF998
MSMQAEAIEGAVEADDGTPRPRSRARFVHVGSRLLVPFALAACALAMVMVVGLHLLPDWGGVNPMFGMLSDYGITRHGWVFDGALDILSLASVAIMVKMAWHGVLTGRPASIAMLCWCVCLVGVATFTKDPNNGTDSLRGALHLYSTAAACGSLPLAGLVVGWRHRRHPSWRRFALTSGGLSLASVPCCLPFLISFVVIRMTHSAGTSGMPTGLVERLMGLVDVAILVVLALWAHRAAKTRRMALTSGTA